MKLSSGFDGRSTKDEQTPRFNDVASTEVSADESSVSAALVAIAGFLYGFFLLPSAVSVSIDL